MRHVEAYANRFGACPPQIASKPEAALKIVVVIPCHNEPDLVSSLDALWQCDPPAWAVEVIVVVNAALGASQSIQQQNEASIRQARAWAATHQRAGFAMHMLDRPGLLPKVAGVGLARKIGMDEALWRFASAGQDDGVILCFDADCTCARNYLQAVMSHFQEHPASPGCSIYFEHPLCGALPPAVYEAVVLYELHLRYYVEALRFAGFPFAFHTIGSSMAVRERVYREQGGMNKRKAGEDFYFLHKIIPLGEFGEVNSTTVHASPRPSDRVPFGTGRAVRQYLADGTLPGYPLAAFRDLKEFFSRIPSLHLRENGTASLSEPLQSYCEQVGFSSALNAIRANTASYGAFRNRFFRWFNGFHAMKYIHYARDHSYSEGNVIAEASHLLRELGGAALEFNAPQNHESALLLLDVYRKRQRKGHQDSACNPTA